jgi:DNA mismatch repair protein MutL
MLPSLAMTRQSSAPPTIHDILLLDPLVANQIAAGEVVERPASVVKELVENSLDAGATHIQIRLKDGGRVLTQVIDNGHGMDGAAAKLAFLRHATSKLRSADELMAIQTFGFRGEALASILAVANVTLTSRRASMDVGVRLSGGGTTVLREEPAGCPVGTDIQIADLFFNVPARQKFLRTAATELGQILRFVDALALARPDLHLTVHHNDRRVVDYPVDPDLMLRTHAVLGADVAARLYPVSDEYEYQVRGLLSEPGLHHGGPGQLTLLVNGRHVLDRTLQHAVMSGYGTLLERGRYPVGVLAVDCPAGTVDVNVHPAKTEVRFVQSQAVFASVVRAIRGMLAGTPWVKGPITAHALPSPSEAPTVRDLPVLSGVRDAGGREPVREQLPSAWRQAPLRPFKHTMPFTTGRQDTIRPDSSEPEQTASTYSSLRYIGQIGKCFLVCETEDAFVLIDQHAAHERILFERFVQRARTQGYATQALLIPLTIPLIPAEVAALDEATDLLTPLGFAIEAAGERAVRVRAVPAILRDRDVGAEVRALAVSLTQGGRGASTLETMERAAATLACHAAWRAGDTMTADDVHRLLREMEGVDLSAYCPHGRPVVFRANWQEVGRWFGRP